MPPRPTLLALALTALLLAAGLWWLWGPGPRLRSPAQVAVPAGAGRRAIAQEMAAAGVVRSAVGFELWSLFHPRQTLKPGTYEFSGEQSVPRVFRALVRAQTLALVVTVPEGFNRFDIAHELAGRGIATAAAFLAVSADPGSIRDFDPAAVSLEGYLFPATYRLLPGMPAQAIAALMTARFRQELRLQPAHPADVHRWVTIASLVEKETAVGTERPLIAGVFTNRLAQTLPLQCDPTVIYAALLAGRYTGALHRADLAFDSPYNTYLHSGLPPGPIANPGRLALQAAAHPDATDDLYFVSDGHGAHRFARTLAEQQHNITLYLHTLHP